MSILDIKLSLSGAWKERFQDVNKLNEYAKTHPIELSNIKIENEMIDGAVINGGLFKATDWKKVSARKSNLTKVVFRNGLLENVDFNDSTLTDVVFEDVTLRGVRFVRTVLNNVRFIHCTLNGVNIDQTKESRIEISRSRVINTSLSDGQLIAVFTNSILTRKTSLTDLKQPSSLTFEKSELDEVDMDRSKLKELTITESKIHASSLKTGSSDSVVINNSEVDISFSESIIGTLSVDNSKFDRLMLNNINTPRITLSNCGQIQFLGMSEGNVGDFHVEKSIIQEFNPLKSKIGTLHIKDSIIFKGAFEKVTIKSLILENVTLDGQQNFTGAHVDELKSNNVTKRPGLKLITDGSNVHF